MLDASEEQWREIADLVAHMARTGEGTDACYEAGALPLPVHFYSPVPDLADLDRRQIWNRVSPLKGIDMRLQEQVRLLTDMAGRYAAECDWPEHEAHPHRFHWRNPSFSFQCASQLRYFLRHFKPRRVIEVGSGFSSRVIGEALLANQAETGVAADYCVVDPFPNIRPGGFPGLTSLKEQRVEDLDPAFFETLGENDLLFIDSGHTVRIGGDVNFLILDVLPVLAPGVLVHVHDICLPREYPREYYAQAGFRMLWTEGYLLQAFLMFNAAWEVLASTQYLRHAAPESLARVFPADPSGIGSGSFWMRRKTTGP